jgi:hypothetical protein
MGDQPKTLKKPAPFKWPIRIGIALVIYTVLGFFVAPAIIKSQMLRRLPALTKRQAAIQQVKCNPYVLSLTIRGLSLTETNGDVFASFDEFYANFQLWASLFKRSWVFDEISLKGPFGQVVYQPDGSFNFANLLTKNAPAPKHASASPAALPAVVIYNLRVTNGALAFADLTRKTPFRTKFIPIEVDLTNLTTVRDKNAPYIFTARTGEGESFGWSGTVSVNPLRSSGTFRLGGLQLSKYSPYSQDYAKFEIANGLVDVAADYRYDSANNPLDLAISNAMVSLTKLELKAPDTGEMLISIPSFTITQAEASIVQRTARVGLIKSSGGSLFVRQNQDGTINLLSMLELPAPKPGEQKASATNAPQPFTTKIDEIAFDDYSIKAEDKKPAKTAAFNIDHLHFDLKGVSNVSNAPITAALALRFQKTGTIGLTGTLTLLPLSADVQLGITNLDVRAAQPYVEEQLKLAITGGALDLQGRARYAPSTPGAPLINFTGSLALNKFATADDVLFKDFAKWDSLAVDGINVDLQPDKIQVDQVKFSGLNTSLIVGPDKRANLQTILQIAPRTNTAPDTASQSPATAAKPVPNVTLGALVFENASIHFADQSIEPHCTFDVQEFGGTIKGLSSQENTTAVVDLQGKVDSHSPFAVTGKVNPLATNLYVDVSVAFTNTELTAFTPYTEKFAGRPLQKGKVSFGVHYLIDKKALKAQNGFYVDQLTLGPKNNSPDATSLPVKLAIALLKDRRGRIQLDVPVTGRIDDPKFRLGPIIWQVVENLIVKAATSPFSLLGAMFGGGEELSFVAFQPGLAAIPDRETNKLETLGKALFERPELTVEINGSVDPATDRAPLARAKFDQHIKSLWVQEQTAAGKAAVALDEVQLDPKDYERLVAQAYNAAFGPYKSSSSETNLTASFTNQPAPAKIETRVAHAYPDDSERGASRLFRTVQSVPDAPKAAAPTTASTNPNPAAATTPAPPESEIADMEAQLIGKIEVTDDDLLDLMKLRAASVQSYLLKSGKVTGDRLFITAPRPMNTASKGEDRVNLTLD